MNGKFVISLDLELQWGMIDHIKQTSPYRQNILNVHKIIPMLISLFEQYEIHATFAIVGFCFFKDYEQMYEWVKNWSKAIDKQDGKIGEYSAYAYFEQVKNDKTAYYFAPDLIEQIRKHPNFEIASHTFSHYCCLEKGSTAEHFREDLQLSKRISAENGIEVKSLVFPRNQINEDYLQICKEEGFLCVRSNPESWMYRASAGNRHTKWKRILRLLDSFVNISGYHCYSLESLKKDPHLNLSAGRFLRPYSMPFMEVLKLWRIKSDMTYSAKQGKIFHLWWHPHNFGANVEENFDSLEKILMHYEYLKNRYGFQSHTMDELSYNKQMPN